MLYLLYILVLVLNFYAWIKGRESKKIIIFSIITLIILFVGNTYNTDYLAYEAIFTYNDFNSIEFGFEVLVKIAKTLGLSFFGFKLILTVLIILLLLFITLKLKVNISGFIFLYTSIQFFIDMVQIRNTISSLFIIISLYFALKKEVRLSMLLIIIASLFHTISLMYLPLVFMEYYSNKLKIILKFMTIIMIIIFPCLLFLGFQNYINYFFKYIFVDTIGMSKSIYFLNEGIHYGCLVFYALAIFNLLIFIILKKIIFSNPLINKNSNYFLLTKINSLEFIYYYCTFFIFLLLIDINFYRIFRNIFIFTYILISQIFPYLITQYEFNKKKVIILSTCIFMFFLTYKVSFEFRGADQTNLILENNIFLEEEKII